MLKHFGIVVGTVPNRFRVGKAQPSVLLTNGGDVMDIGCGAGLDSGFGVIMVTSLGVVGLVVTSLRS